MWHIESSVVGEYVCLSVCKFALKLTQNVISPDLILKQKSITIKTLYSDTQTHTHTQRVSENKFWQNHCYLFSDGSGWPVETRIIRTHSGWLQVKSYFRNSLCTLRNVHSPWNLHTGVWDTSIQSIYLIGQITLFSFSHCKHGNCNRNFWTCSDISAQFETGDTFSRSLAHSFITRFFIAYKMLHLRSDCDTTTQIGLHQTWYTNNFV